MAKLIKIYTRPKRQADIIEANSVKLVPGSGIEGDHFRSGKRQVTIMSQKVWDDVCQNLGQDLDPKIRRANFLIDDIDLKESIGKVVKVGSIKILIHGETTPCRLMEEAAPGLKNALLNWQGGAFGEVLNEGIATIGDNVSLQCCKTPYIGRTELPSVAVYFCSNCKTQTYE
jgi:hypothetical protein